MRVILFFIVILLLSPQIILPQDSTVNKTYHTKKFDLTIENPETLKNNKRESNNTKEEKIFEDCNKIFTSSESGFSVNHKLGTSSVLYNNIKEISFKVSTYRGEGILVGALSGFLTAGIITIAVTSASTSDSKSGFSVLFYTFIPACIIGGTTIGWIVGANSYERENFDLTKYEPNKRKEVSLKLFIEHRLNF